jgi:cyd operon protein YbgT
MWYFAWILGIGLAVSFAVLNAMWLELSAGHAAVEDPLDDGDDTALATK